MSMFSPAACLATKNLGSRRSTACCAAPHFDSVEDNPDMPCEFGEANRKRVRHMFPFLGFPLALSINENSNSEVTEDGIFLVGEWIAWTQLKLCPDKERSSWREQHIACTGIQDQCPVQKSRAHNKVHCQCIATTGK
ncbi:hypothetical protein MUK42_21423, partial [Musa troglodytarum]